MKKGAMRQAAISEGTRWLTQAQADLKWSRHLGEQGAHYLVCFLAHQIVEKALKVFLYAQGADLITGHSVRQLCGRAAECNQVLAQHQDEWSILDSYYLPTRYPNYLPGDDIPANVYNKPTAMSALELGEAIISIIERWFADNE